MTPDFYPFEGTIESLYPPDGGHIRTAIVRFLSINGKILPQHECPHVKTVIQPDDHFRVGDYVFGRAVVDEEGTVQQISEMTTKVPDPSEPAPPTLETVYGMITEVTPIPDDLTILDVDVVSIDGRPTPGTTLRFPVTANYAPKGQHFEALLKFNAEGYVVQVVDFRIVAPKPEQSFKPIDGTFVAIKGTIVEVEPYGDGSYITVTVHSINDRPAGEEWGFPILETNIQVESSIIADLILDKADGEVKEVANFTITPPEPEPVFGAITNLIEFINTHKFRSVAVEAYRIGDDFEIDEPCELVIPVELAYSYQHIKFQTKRISNANEEGAISGRIIGIDQIYELHSGREIKGYRLVTVGMISNSSVEVRIILPASNDLKRGDSIIFKTVCEPTNNN